MAKPPAFQFYAKDWLSSPRVQLMTPSQRGAYIQLLAYCWDSGDCSLPDDDIKLAALSGLGQEWSNGSSTPVRECFILHPVKSGHLTNDRLYKERVKQEEWRVKCAEAGLKSGENRRKSKVKRRSKAPSTKRQPAGSGLVELNGNSASASALVSLTEILFSRFWKEYPLKVGKQNAVKSFQKCCPDEPTLESILAGGDRWRKSQQWTRDAGKYIHHPATFLNQRRWEEFPTPEQLKSPPKPGEKLDIVDGKPPPGWDDPIPPWQPPKKTTGGAA